MLQKTSLNPIFERIAWLALAKNNMGKGEKVDRTLFLDIELNRAEDYKCALSQSMHVWCSKFGTHVASLDQLESAYMCSLSQIVDGWQTLIELMAYQFSARRAVTFSQIKRWDLKGANKIYQCNFQNFFVVRQEVKWYHEKSSPGISMVCHSSWRSSKKTVVFCFLVS